MNINSNLVIICFTVIICTHIIMSKLFNIFTIKESNKLIKNDFIKNLIEKNLEKENK